MRRSTWTAAAIMAVLSAGMLAGCNSMNYLAYLFAPSNTRKVPAEFDGLKNHKVAVVVYATYGIRSDYPDSPREVAYAVARELSAKVKGVQVMNPQRVDNYQERHLDWETKPKTRLARELGVDYIVFVSLIEFSTREFGDQNVYRGRLTAEAAVYDAAGPENRAKVWPKTGQGSGLFRVLFPEKRPVVTLSEDDTAVRLGAERMLAIKLVKKFHAYEEQPE